MGLLFCLVLLLELSRISAFAPLRSHRIHSSISFQLTKGMHPPTTSNTLMMWSDEEESSKVDVDDPVAEELDEELDEEEEVTEEETVAAAAAAEVATLSPYEQAVKDLETSLRSEVSTLESMLKSERTSLLKTKDRVSESGKNGYFIVQAQVAEFQKKRDADQKSRVTRNKREFVLKMATVVDEFRAAREVAPPTNEREEKMHSTFESLLNSILTVFNKYGYEEYDAEVGSKLVPNKHQVAEVVEGEEDGVIVRQLKRGIMNKDGEILRYVLFPIHLVLHTLYPCNPY